MNKEIEDLQIRIAFQEDALQECSAALARQQAEITLLRKALFQLESRVRELTPPQFGSPADEPPPPHY